MKTVNVCTRLIVLSPILLSHTNLGRFVLNKKEMLEYLGLACLN